MLSEKLKKIDLKKVSNLFIYFVLIYLATECLNGNNGDYFRMFGENYSIWNKIHTILYDICTFFYFPKFLYAGVIYACVYKVFNTIFKDTRFSCVVISTISVLFSVINYIVIQVRGTAISIADILSVQTALNVSKGISFDINGFFICGILFYIIANIFIWKRNSKVPNQNSNEINKDVEQTNKMRAKYVTPLVSLFIILYFIFLDPYIFSLQVWDINLSYKQNGSALTLIRLARDLKIDEPQNYSGDIVEEILNKYDESGDTSNKDYPNVLVVMNESFSDILNLYDIDASGDNLPFFHSLLSGDNIISGNMHSSFIGGRTANVEFEFLTQNTITAFPVGSYPYQQYISENVKESLAYYMNSLDYNTYAIHSWYESGYNRKKIYDLMNFNNVLFKEDMPNLESLFNEYSTDSSTYNYWYDSMNSKSSGDKNFTFLLTVQNHLPYEKNEESHVEYVSGDDDLNAYLNFIKESDNALKELIDFSKNYEEEIIILFFGDHQPNLNLNEKYGPNEFYNEEKVSYIVPFFIWANYDIDEKSNIETSANFLQNILIEAAKLPENEYDKYVDSIKQEIPVITMQYYIDKFGNKYDINDNTSPYYDKIEEYKSVVYYQMFDETN